MSRPILLLTLITMLAACNDATTAPESSTRDVDAAPELPGGGAFQITLRYVGSPSPRQQLAVERAVAQWQRVIASDLTSVPVKAEAGACFRNQPAIDETIDDILIFIDFTYVDGPGNILGEAGPCFIRSESGLPVIGFLRLDNADLREMEAIGTMDDVVLHEIGHVLGIGTLWSRHRLLSGTGGPDPRYTGAAAVSAYRAVGGLAGTVPVENTGDSSTREGHWRESVFGNELMTGWIGSGANPRSAVTIASLEDLGYNADAEVADAYALGSQVDALAQRSGSHTDLRGRERVLRPKFHIDRRGRRHQPAAPPMTARSRA